MPSDLSSTERSRRHPPKAATVVIRAALDSEETGAAFHPGGGSYLRGVVIPGGGVIPGAGAIPGGGLSQGGCYPRGGVLSQGGVIPGRVLSQGGVIPGGVLS